jgi:LysR family nitrogen assimilation transcriptional regulator
MDNRQLKTFLKIAELGSITRAADALGLAQPSVSQQLLRLEDEVGAKLFRRTARGVAVTESGRVFQEHARRMLQIHQSALDDLQKLKGEVAGPVSVAMPVSVSIVLGETLVTAALKHAPQVALRLVETFSGHIRASLDRGEIDLGLLYDVGSVRHLSVCPLAREELYLAGPPGKLAGVVEGVSVPIQALGELPMILPGPEHGMRQFIEGEAHRRHVQLRVRTEVDSLRHMLRLVGGGYGYTVATLPALADDLAAGRLSATRIEGGAIRRTVCLVRNPDREMTRASVRIEALIIRLIERMIAKGSWQAERDGALG